MEKSWQTDSNKSSLGKPSREITELSSRVSVSLFCKPTNHAYISSQHCHSEYCLYIQNGHGIIYIIYSWASLRDSHARKMSTAEVTNSSNAFNVAYKFDNVIISCPKGRLSTPKCHKSKATLP
jgi:hypothetical protein